VTIRGLLALGKLGSRNWFTEGKEDGDFRLSSTGHKVSLAIDQPGDWPVYRKDSKRSNATGEKIDGPLKTLWSRKLGETELTPVTLAYGRAFVAEQRAGRVICLDARTGKEAWSIVTDGRIEFPPALYKGICLIATCAGSVYGLDAKNGREVWRVRAAPVQKFIGDRNQFASSWPVIGGVLVRNDIAYFSVGRTQSQLGGLWLYAVDPATGKVRWRERGGTSGDSSSRMTSHLSTPPPDTILPRGNERDGTSIPECCRRHGTSPQFPSQTTRWVPVSGICPTLNSTCAPSC